MLAGDRADEEADSEKIEEMGTVRPVPSPEAQDRNRRVIQVGMQQRVIPHLQSSRPGRELDDRVRVCA
jgi:hypothetical protein